MAKTEKAKVDTSAITGGFKSDMASALKGAGVEVAEEAPPAKKGEAAPSFSDVIVGKEFQPPRILVYGIDGVGKSTLASQAPNVIFIQTGDELGQIGAARFPVCTHYSHVIQRLRQVADQAHEYQTLAIDHLSGLEKLIFDKVAQGSGKSSIDLVGGGFDKGQKLAMSEWGEVMELLNKCWNRGMAIILIAHARSEKLGDPENPMAEQFAPALHRKTSCEMFRRWADAILFLTRRMTVKKEGQGIMEKQIPVAIGADGGERIIRTQWTPGSVGKNRYNIPMEIPFEKEGAFDLVMSYISSFYEEKGQ